ncbi:N-formylglutamate amidohydrolase [Ovoidimarina sediminis]|uniref:N-formylglutamate amidohydrolase n=1 Tax=Ovoidimarina sediminis TaxID=3079856 RepID=UPI0029152C9A|nr:N-formylglutamate amidohydrolase [Rhodophyticola sp. MJ-SS7]MDU8942698.1 N-formylglutamate amidohydrolase [Rhodophyticola sp. MJ-SS7]
MLAAYELAMPEAQTTSVLFASPHSGRDYPASFLRRSILDQQTIRSSEDAFVDLLFDCAPRFGSPLLAARSPRAYIDFNRSAEELDPALIEDVRSTGHNPRVSSGLGVVPRVVANGRAIYRGKLSRREADQRIREHWYPYHQALDTLLKNTVRHFDEAILVDCHSMPHEALENVVHPKGIRPDIVLGDRFGAAAGGAVVDRIEAAFAAAGLSVIRNAPFAGAFSAQRYGRPSRGQHVIQVEIDRSLYMDEARIRPNANFKSFRQLIEGIVAEITAIGREDATPLAAE